LHKSLNGAFDGIELNDPRFQLIPLLVLPLLERLEFFGMPQIHLEMVMRHDTVGSGWPAIVSLQVSENFFRKGTRTAN
jgi:hypothetical protein